MLEILRRRLKARGEKGADEAIRALERGGAVLVDAGADLLREFLSAWSRGDERAALEYLHTQASAREVIDAVRASTQELESAVKRRREIEAGLLELARDLGIAGVRLVLAAVLPG